MDARPTRAVPRWLRAPARRARSVLQTLVARLARVVDALRLAALPVAAAVRWRSRRSRSLLLDAAVPRRGDGPDLSQASMALIGPMDRAGWDAAAAGSSAEYLVFLASTSTPVDVDWSDALLGGVLAARAAGRRVVAAVPRAVHPARPWWRRTPVDLTVRECGAVVALDHDGAPVLRAVGAGAPVESDPAWHPVAVGSGACLLVERAAFEAVGGFADLRDPDAAAVDLCLRLRAADAAAEIVAVPDSLIFDDRRLSRAADLRGVVGSLRREAPGWREVVERHGARLRRLAAGAAAPSDADRLEFVFVVAAGSDKVIDRWGDTHLARDLAAALTRLGHGASVVSHAHRDDLAVRSADALVVVRGLAPVRAVPGQRQVLWVISHPNEVTDAECDAADLVLVASARFAEVLRSRTTTPVEVLLQATDVTRFHPEARAGSGALAHPEAAGSVVVVAKTRDVLRPMVPDAVTAGHRPVVYGSGWAPFGFGDLVASDYLSNADLPGVYASAAVVLNDHWADMAAEGFVSNRLADVLASGTPVVSDPMPEIAALFDGAVWEADGPADLRRCLDEILAGGPEVAARVARGTAAVRAAHTVDQRAVELLAAIRRHGLA